RVLFRSPPSHVSSAGSAEPGSHGGRGAEGLLLRGEGFYGPGAGHRLGNLDVHVHDRADHRGIPGQAALRLSLFGARSEEHTSELQSRENLVCRLLLEKKKTN